MSNKPKVTVSILNPAQGGVAKCLKANYYKMNYTNFIEQQNYCASGVVEKYNEEMPVKIISYTRDRNGNVVSRHLKDVANTLNTTSPGSNTSQYLLEYDHEEMKNRILQCTQGNVKPKIYDNCTTITTSSWEYQNFIITRYRIRKLTNRECFRLMDMDDEDIDKIEDAGVSRTQQYKMAGNSIVVSCLEHILEQLFFPAPLEDCVIQFYLF